MRFPSSSPSIESDSSVLRAPRPWSSPTLFHRWLRRLRWWLLLKLNISDLTGHTGATALIEREVDPALLGRGGRGLTLPIHEIAGMSSSGDREKLLGGDNVVVVLGGSTSFAASDFEYAEVEGIHVAGGACGTRLVVVSVGIDDRGVGGPRFVHLVRGRTFVKFLQENGRVSFLSRIGRGHIQIKIQHRSRSLT